MASDGKIDIDSSAVVAELGDLGEISERVRLAGYGLASPLLAMRMGQMEREVARVTAREGESDPEVRQRAAAHTELSARVALFKAETGRVRVTPVPPANGENAAIRGRVLRNGDPVADAHVIAATGGKQIGFACTDANGGFSLEVPGGTDIILSVKTKTDGLAYRDSTGNRYAPGQMATREIDLGRATPPCEPPTDNGDEPAKTVKTPSIIGQTPEGAKKLLDEAGLMLGEIGETPSEDKQIGLVVKQKPEANATVPRGAAVAILVGVGAKKPKDARENVAALRKARRKAGG
jgi:hypothetical protein